MCDETSIELPPHAHIPGVNARHAAGMFDAIRASVEGVDVTRLHRTKAWQHGLTYLEKEYFWESHEVMEAVWLACPPNSPEKLFVQSLIQRANAGLKRRMGMQKAADRLEQEAARLRSEAQRRKPGGLFDIVDNA